MNLKDLALTSKKNSQITFDFITSLIKLEDYALDNFCRTHCAHHSEKTCPYFLNSFYTLLLPSGTLEKENKNVEEENYEDEEREVEELKEAQHPPSLILDWDET